MLAKKFAYNSVQSHSLMENGQGRTQVMEVRIKSGKGNKKVTLKNARGQTIASKTITLNNDEIGRIMNKEFIPGLFRPCLNHCNNKSNNIGSGFRLRSTRKKTRNNNI